MTRSLQISIALGALLLCGTNAIKPLVVDDPAFVAVAQQIVRAPLDPYGFEIFWYQLPSPAAEVLAPPVVPYWLAGAMAVLGDEPSLWKLSLLPFTWLLCAGVASLLRRLAPGSEIPLLWLAITLPALWPNLNLMLDVPALALGVGALALFARACDDERLALVLAAGLLGGLAMQTKYTGVTHVAAMLAYGLHFSRVRLALVAGAVAAVVWLSWETFVFLQYGTSQLVHVFGQLGMSARAPSGTLLGLLALLGGAAPATGLLALVAAGARTATLIGATLLASIPFAVLPALPRAVQSSALLPTGPNAAGPELLVYTLLGIGVVTAAAAAAWQARDRLREADGSRSAPVAPLRFALSWLVIELVTFPLLAPFLATRRVVGIAVALVVAMGCIVCARFPASRSRPRLAAISAWGAALGLLFVAADTSDAIARRQGIRASVDRLAALRADLENERVFFSGHWGPQFYAQRAGYIPLIPGSSQVRASDWIIIAEGVKRQRFGAAPEALETAAVVSVASPLPWSTIPSAYLGRSAMRPQPESQIRLLIYRAASAFVPTSRARAPKRLGPRLFRGERSD